MIGLRSISLIATLAVAALPGFGQEPDVHVSLDPAAVAYKHSAFLHGYAHGYEMGFHNGDLELHMGRPARDAKSFRDYKTAKKFYRDDFGSRDAFTDGYQQGFKVGYGDAYMGRDFREAQEVRTIAEQMRETGATDPKPDKNFDKSFEDGYKQGVGAGLSDARKDASFRGEVPPCQAKKEGECLARGMGYRLGYSDGFNNQRKPQQEVKTASD